jgi:hypothetical protein
MDQTKRPKGRPPAERTRTAQLRIRAFPDWAAWLTSAADQTGRDASDIIAEGLVLWARKHKLPAPPER